MGSLTRRFGLAVAVLGMVAGAAGQARADLTVYFDRTAFNAATTGTSTIGFEGIAGGGLAYKGSSFTLSGVTLSDGGAGHLFVLDKNWYQPGLSSDYLNENDGNTQSIDITPTAGTTALGTDFGNLNSTFGSSLSITVATTNGSGTSTYNLTAPSQPNLAFVGFTSDTAILDVKFSGVFLVLDNVTTGQADPVSAPEPSALAYAATGVLTLAGFAWRKRRRARVAA
jgi:hypothetical protein